jgi:hypothetical protein
LEQQKTEETGQQLEKQKLLSKSPLGLLLEIRKSAQVSEQQKTALLLEALLSEQRMRQLEEQQKMKGELVKPIL